MRTGEIAGLVLAGCVASAVGLVVLLAEGGEHGDVHDVHGPGGAPTAVAVAAGEARAAGDRAAVHLPGVPGGVASDDGGELIADHLAGAGKVITALADIDARGHPGVTVSLESLVVAAATGRVRELGGTLTEVEMRAVLTEAGWPVAWHDDALAVAWCESHWSPYAVGDGGNSLGAWQLWRGWWAAAGEDLGQWADPLTNARVALYVRATRGRFGGPGGWSCAERMGVP